MLLFHVFHRLCAGLFGEARLAGVRRLQFDPQVRGIQLAFVFDRCRFSRVPWHLFQGFIFRCPYELSSSASIRRGTLRPTHSFLRRGFDICQYGHESPR